MNNDNFIFPPTLSLGREGKSVKDKNEKTKRKNKAKKQSEKRQMQEDIRKPDMEA